MTASFPLLGRPSCEKTAHQVASMASLVMQSLFMQAGDITTYTDLFSAAQILSESFYLEPF